MKKQIGANSQAISELSKEDKALLRQLEAKPDAQIDVSDIPPLDDEFWIQAVQNPFYKPTKQATTVRVDSDVLAWLKAPGKGYQTRLNQVLRKAMLDDLRQRHELG